MADTSIEWADAVWNPVTGCMKVSEGCRNCYAATIAHRLWVHQYPPVRAKYVGHRPRRFTDVRCHEDRLGQPLMWRKPRRVFVNSMSDLFHEDVPYDFIRAVFVTMGDARARDHTFLVLTKRPERMREILTQWEAPWPLPNVWIGVSAENQATADERIPLLLETPAAVRFVSCEPLLGPLALRPRDDFSDHGHGKAWLGEDRIGWIIVGGESGHNARPCDVQWIRWIVEQCQWSRCPVFVKQLGSHYVDAVNGVGGVLANPDPQLVPAIRRLKNRKGADLAEWPEDLRVRDFPEVRRV